jgi:geranylgeranylglycerol-phosphate geranylgeranyltransferase
MIATSFQVLDRAGRCCAALAQLVRLRNALFGTAYALLGAYLVADLAGLAAPPVLVASVVVLLVVACGNVVNDYRDADADAVAKPARPIPSGRISRRAAGWIAIALGLGAALIAATLGPALGVFALFAIVLSVAYSYVLKEIPLVGNLSVGVLCGAILVFGALAAGSVTLAVALSCAMTGLFVFAQEIFYTVEDAPGDRASGVRTTATTFGVGNALRVFKALAVLFIVVVVSPWFLGLVSNGYLYVVTICTILPTVVVVVLLSGTPTEATIARASRLTRVVWLSSIATVALLR